MGILLSGAHIGMHALLRFVAVCVIMFLWQIMECSMKRGNVFMSRTVSYKCDRCREPVSAKAVVRVLVNLQEGGKAAEKKPFDFCPDCFAILSKAFEAAMDPDFLSDEAPGPDPVDGAVHDAVPAAADEAADAVPVHKESALQAPPAEDPVASGPVQQDGTEGAVQDIVSEVPVPEPASASVPDTAPGNDSAVSEDGGDGFVLGPISADEKTEILRLYVQEGLSPYEIAAKMRRLPRGIKRTINSAEKSGELDRLRREGFPSPVPAAADTENASDADSDDEPEDGISDARIGRYSKVDPPTVDVIDGKKYDSGCILALARAGWPIEEIAKERHYNPEAVRRILEQRGFL